MAASSALPNSAAGGSPVPARAPSPRTETVGVPGGLPPIDELRAICRGMRRALTNEYRAATADRATLGPGQRLQVTATGVEYGFSAPRAFDASPGDPALLCRGEEEYRVVITRCGHGAVELSISHDIGPAVPEGWELTLDVPWLIERLRARVLDSFTEGLETPALFNLRGALRVLGIGEIAVAADGTTPVYEDTRRPLNEEQSRAVSTAFRSPVIVIASPAGTGKTLTIGAIVEAAWRAGMRALVSAPSNVAVDLLMMQIAERLRAEPEFAQGGVLRLGSDAGPALRRAYGDFVVLPGVVARLQPELQARIADLQHTADELAAQLTRAQAADPTEGAGALRDVENRLVAARVDLEHEQRAARRFGRSLIAGARVVGATLARVFVDDTLRGFDLVIIDEASVAQAPAVFVAAGLARHHVVIAGDPYQLAAPVRSTGPNRHWLAEDVFQRLDVIRAIRDDEYVEYITQLIEQRRCADDICEMQRQIWYGPGLRTAREVIERERRRHNVIFGTNALCYIDTAPLRPRAHHPWGRTLSNDSHAALIADLLAYLDSAGELPDEGCPSGEVLVLSHYRGQVANLRRLLGKRYRNRGVTVSTVHSAQGSEATTAILDLTVASNVPANISSVLTAVRPEHDGSRLLAVAASRARSRLIVVGDLQWIERAAPRQTVLRRLVAHLRQNAYRIPIEELRPASGRLQLVH